MAKTVTSAAVIDIFQMALKERWGYIWGTAGVMWTQAKQDQIEKTTDSDRAQARKYGSKWIGHYVSDCSGLFSYAYAHLGGYMYHGSDTMYRKYCVEKGELKQGKRTDSKTLKPGTAVFVWNGTKYSHVGLYVGNGIVIEAASTINGVITSKVTSGKWTHWGELKDMVFSDEVPAPVPEQPQEKKYPTIKRGSKGTYVKKAQELLMKFGYRLPKYGADGDFGAETEAAVKSFQKNNGLKDDGIVGEKTWGKLLSAKTEEKKYTVTVTGLTFSQAKALCDMYQNASYKEMV